jgi:hypothetical protein
MARHAVLLVLLALGAAAAAPAAAAPRAQRRALLQGAVRRGALLRPIAFGSRTSPSAPANATLPANASLAINVTAFANASAPVNGSTAANVTAPANVTAAASTSAPANATAAAANASVSVNGTTAANVSVPLNVTAAANTSAPANASLAANVSAPANVSAAANANAPANASAPASVSAPANASVAASASAPANVSSPANVSAPANASVSVPPADSPPPVAAAPTGSPSIAVPPEGVCDVSAGQVLTRAQEEGCYYLAGDRAAAAALLFGPNATAANLSARTPPPIVTAAAAPGRVPLFAGFGAALPDGPQLPGAAGARTAGARADSLWTTSEDFRDAAVNSSFIVLADAAGAAPPAALQRPAGDLTPNPHTGRALPGTGGAVVVVTYRGAGGRGGGLMALNLRTGATVDLLSAAGAGGLGRAFNGPTGLEIVPVPSAYVDGSNTRANATFAVALFSDPAGAVDLGTRTGARAQDNAVWAVTLLLPAAGTAFADPSTRWAPSLASPPRVVADGFVRPGAIAVSPDRETAYIADTGRRSGGGALVAGASPPLAAATASGPPLRTWVDRPSSIAAFALGFSPSAAPTLVLAARRTLATPTGLGVFGSLAVDAAGTLWAGEGGAVSALDPVSGRLLLQVRNANATGAFVILPAAAAPAGDDAGPSAVAPGGGVLAFAAADGFSLATVALPGLRPFNPDAWLRPLEDPDGAGGWGLGSGGGAGKGAWREGADGGNGY